MDLYLILPRLPSHCLLEFQAADNHFCHVYRLCLASAAGTLAEQVLKQNRRRLAPGSASNMLGHLHCRC